MVKSLSFLLIASVFTIIATTQLEAQAPVNDDCSGIINVSTTPFGAACVSTTSATTLNASTSSPTPVCGGTAGADDIWYSFTANSRSVIIRVSDALLIPSGTASMSMTVYNANVACGALLTQVFCANGFAFGNGFRIVDGLTIGNSYFIRFYVNNFTGNSNATFNFCVQDVPAPPVNDECANATAISTQPFGISCAAAVSANTTGATQSPLNPNCTIVDNNDDIWYSFVAASGSVILRFSNAVQTTSGLSGNLGYALYNTECPSVLNAGNTLVSCNNNIGNGSGHQIISGLTIGNIYILRLFSTTTNNYMRFDFCVQDVPAPPSNDECSGAIELPLTLPGSICMETVSTNTTGATHSVNDPACIAANATNDDIWYKFTASSGTAILRFSNCIDETTNLPGALGFAVYSSCPSNSTALACSNSIGTTSGATTLTGLTAGNVYLLRLFSTANNNYISFKCCLQAPLANDECLTAINIPVSNGFCNSPVLASLNGATSSAGFGTPSCRIGGPSRDVWFKTTIPSTGNLIIQTSAVKTAASDLVMTAYAGVCGSLTEIACDDNGNPETFPSSEHSRITLSGRTPGEIILLRVTAATVFNEEQFAICAWDETISVLPPVTPGGDCLPASTRTIDSTQGNMYMWVPIFDNNGNITAEIYSDGKNLGDINTNVFVNRSGSVRSIDGQFYLDRNITINPASNLAAKLRFYFKDNEFTALKNVDPVISSLSGLGINKTSTACQSAFGGQPGLLTQAANANYGADHYLQFTSPSFSSFYIAKAGIALPVSLSSFTAQCVKEGTRISWTTATETNTGAFVIEKSMDGITFTKLARLDARGNSNSPKQYIFIDKSTFAQNTHFRLQQLDADGKFSYSKIILADCRVNNGNPVIYPNPATHQLTVQLKQPGNNYSVVVTDALGQLVWQQNSIPVGNSFSIDVSNLKAGVYLLTLRSTKNSFSSKFIKTAR